MSDHRSLATSGDAPDETDAPPLDRLPLIRRLTDLGFTQHGELPNWFFNGPPMTAANVAVVLMENGLWFATSRQKLTAPFSTRDEMDLAIIYLTLYWRASQ